MTNVLVPTDFTPASLKVAEGALASGQFQKCNIVLFHAFELPDSPFDLIGCAYKDPSYTLITEAFRQACKQLKDDHGKQVNKIIVRCMTGHTRSLFRNWTEANDIDLIFCPEDYHFNPPHIRSVDPLYLFKKCGIPVLKGATRKGEVVVGSSYFSTAPVSVEKEFN